jgi:hypothetical protein
VSALSQLQNLLRDLFQLELADLDFGLYRLLHLKRHEIEALLTEQLPRGVDTVFLGMAVEERAALQQEVSNLAAHINQEVAEDALLPSGEISAEYRLATWVNDQDTRTYRAVKGRNRDGRRVLILWRDMKDLDPSVERRFLEAKLKAEGSFEEVLINGDAATPGFRSLDGLFKGLMEEEER